MTGDNIIKNNFNRLSDFKGNGTVKINNTPIEKNKSTIDVRQIGTDYTYKHEIVWINVIAFLILHLASLQGAYFLLTGRIKLVTFMWGYLIGYMGGQGILLGAHRYFTHRAYKVKPVMRFIFLLWQTIAGQNTMFTWTRDHRLHHRYSDTDADPHNSKRGFFFSHMGWLMMKKHPYVIELGRRIDMSDLSSDWMVMFQKKYYLHLYIVFAVLIPTWVPIHFFGESFLNSFLTCYAFRYVCLLHTTWLVNSAAHIYGTRPYDKNLQPVESWFVSFMTMGEGWHNYHHAFPWDYKAAELPTPLNGSARWIQLFEWMGLAYDLKTATPEMVKNRILRTGDGTHYEFGNDTARAAVTAKGFLHPLNPTYNVTYLPPSATVGDEGLPLFHETDKFVKLRYNSCEKNKDI